MFGFGKRSSTSPAPVEAEPSDQYRMKSTGQRVTLLQRLAGGDVVVADDSGGVYRQDIVKMTDVTPL